MNSDDTLDHLVDLISFYKQKIKDGTLSGSEGSNYIKSLMLLGLRDATIRTRHLEQISNGVEVLDLPFEGKS
jgi:hypothetical protein